MKNATWYGSCLALPLLGALGCSDPVPPPPEGSASFTLGTSPAPDPGYMCPANYSYQAGAPAPDANTSGVPLIDGQSGVSVSCSVKNGLVQASLVAPAKATNPAGAAQIRLGFTGAFLANGMPTYGTASANTSDLTDTIATTSVDQTMTDRMCTFVVLQGQLKNGAVWASFNCPHMQAAPTIECRISGEFVFQDCDGA